MLTELQSSFLELKKKIQYLEDTEKSISGLETRSFKSNNADKRLKELLQESEEPKIQINVSGKTYVFNCSKFINSCYRNMIKDILSKEDAAKPREEIFLDVPLPYFEKVLEIIGKTSNKKDIKELELSMNFLESGIKQEDESEKFDIKSLDFSIDLKSICNLRSFFDFLKEFFKTDFNKVVGKFNFPYIDEDEIPDTDVTKYIKSQEIKDAFSINDVLKLFRAESYKDIIKKDNKLAFFVDSFEGQIVFEFSKNVKVSSITTKPFSELPEAWFPELKPRIMGSLDGENWDTVYTPDQYSDDYSLEESTVKIEPKKLKFLKFETNQSVFSISYLKVTA